MLSKIHKGLLGVLVICSACGTGGEMGDARKSPDMNGYNAGTKKYSGFENADQPIASSANTSAATETTDSAQTLKSGATPPIGKPASQEMAMKTSSSAIDKTAQTRALQNLIGTNPHNRSRVGQSMRADNPQRSKEEIFTGFKQ